MEAIRKKCRKALEVEEIRIEDQEAARKGVLERQRHIQAENEKARKEQEIKFSRFLGNGEKNNGGELIQKIKQKCFEVAEESARKIEVLKEMFRKVADVNNKGEQAEKERPNCICREEKEKHKKTEGCLEGQENLKMTIEESLRKLACAKEKLRIIQERFKCEESDEEEKSRKAAEDNARRLLETRKLLEQCREEKNKIMRDINEKAERKESLDEKEGRCSKEGKAERVIELEEKAKMPLEEQRPRISGARNFQIVENNSMVQIKPRNSEEMREEKVEKPRRADEERAITTLEAEQIKPEREKQENPKYSRKDTVKQMHDLKYEEDKAAELVEVSNFKKILENQIRQAQEAEDKERALKREMKIKCRKEKRERLKRQRELEAEKRRERAEESRLQMLELFRRLRVERDKRGQEEMREEIIERTIKEPCRR